MRKALLIRQLEPADLPRTMHFVGLPPGNGSDGASRELLPMATVLVLEETIERGHRSYLLIRYAADGTFAGDTWHSTIDEAVEQASYEFGEALGPWVQVPPEVEDARAFILRSMR
jgi:hypothetical protein